MTDSDPRADDSPDSGQSSTAIILFSDLVDSTGTARKLGDKQYSDRIDELQLVYERIVDAHGGRISQISGDGMMAAFGHPEPQESDTRRAIEAALALRDAVRALGRKEQWRSIEPKLRASLHSGWVVFKAGDAMRGRFQLHGQATNIARHLCDEAGPDQILVSTRTLGPQRRLFDVGAPFTLRVRGGDTPLPTVAILGRTAAKQATLSPFVGRARQLGRLIDGLEAVRRGDAVAIALRGPPGEGKTRLADEFLRVAVERGHFVHRSRCEEAAGPLDPILQLVRSIFGIGPALRRDRAAARLKQGLDALGPALAATRFVWMRLLSLGAGRGATVESGEAAEALRMLIDRLGTEAPLILFIDDWHAADDASRAMLRAIGGARGCYLLLTARLVEDDDSETAGREIVDLPPLGETDTARLIDLILKAAGPFSAAKIRRWSGGKPLFIEEICHACAAGDVALNPIDGSGWLDGLIQSRLRRLPGAQQKLVRTAAVIGEVVPSWLIETLCDRDAADPLVTGLAEADFIFPGAREGTLRFKHGITRDTVYGRIGASARKAMHGRVAEAIRNRDGPEDEGSIEMLAYHYGRAEQWPDAADFSECAGDRALGAGAIDRAQDHYRDALLALDRMDGHSGNGRRWIGIAERFGRVAVFDPAAEQVEICQRAVRQAQFARDPIALARAHFWLGYVHYGLGQSTRAIPHFARAIDSAGDAEDEPLAIQSIAALGQAKAAACDYAGALPLLDEAIAALRRHRSRRLAPIGLAYSLSCKGFALGDMSRFDEARACFQEGEAALAGHGHPGEVSVLNQHAVVCLWERRIDEAIALAGAGMRVAERVGSNYSHAMSRSIAAHARWLAGQDPADVQTLLGATRWLEARQRAQFTSLNHGWLAEMLVASGRLRESLAHAKRALRRAALGDRLGEAMALRALARRAARTCGARAPSLFLDCASHTARARASPHEQAANLSCRTELGLTPAREAAWQGGS